MASITYLSYMSYDDSAKLSIGVTKKILTITEETGENSADLPMETVKKYSPTVREMAHVVLFLILGALMVNAVSNKQSLKSAGITLGICVLYALFDEIFQECLQKGRSFELNDLAKDILGSICGILICWGIHILVEKIGFKIRKS